MATRARLDLEALGERVVPVTRMATTPLMPPATPSYHHTASPCGPGTDHRPGGVIVLDPGGRLGRLGRVGRRAGREGEAGEEGEGASGGAPGSDSGGGQAAGSDSGTARRAPQGQCRFRGGRQATGPCTVGTGGRGHQGVGTMGALLAQAAADPISGGAGWFGAGLLGSVLAWLLLVHLPARDKQLKDILDRHDARLREKDSEIGTLAQLHRDALDTAIKAYREELRIERETCERRDAALMRQLAENNKALVASLDKVGLSVERHHEVVTGWVEQLREQRGG